jgi:Fe-S cluster assembly protein SufD
MGAPLDHTRFERAVLEALSGLDAEDWRVAYRERLRSTGLPTKRVEAWKWSDFRNLSGELDVLDGVPAMEPAIAPLTVGGPELRLVNSALVHDDDLPAGVSIDVDGAPESPRATGETAELAAALAPSAALITLAGRIATPVLLRWLDAGPEIAGGHVALRVEAEAEAVLVETHEGGGAARLVEVELGEGARFTHIILVEEGADDVAAKAVDVDLAPNAVYRQTTLSFGAKLSRLETHIRHAGQGAEAHLGAVYLLAEGRQADFTSVVTHEGPGGVTSQLVKGAAIAHAQGVFQGKFKVERAAQQTDARMTHRALMLDERAEIDAKPELEIYADDVQCAHGNALGALDETALFYLRQRGIPESRARALLIESFLAEPLDAVENDAIREGLLAKLRERLGVST